jgi:hypothetical protein
LPIFPSPPAALAVYRTIDRHLDIAVLALAAKDIWLMADLISGPIDLFHRLNPVGLGGFKVFAIAPCWVASGTSN